LLFRYHEAAMEIFLLRLDRIGDFVLGVPAYRALRRAHPSDRITVVVPSDVGELAQACPYFDEVYLYDALWLRPGHAAWDRWKSAWKLIRFLRSKPVDLLLDFRYQNRLDPLVAGLSGAAKRIGFDLGWVSRFLSVKVPPPPPGEHQINRNLRLLRALGIRDEDARLEVWFDERDRKTGESHLPSQELLPGIPRIAVHIGAATPSKRWREESFEVLMHELHAQTQAQILVLGGEQDLGFSQEVLEGLECPVLNLVGKLTLRQMTAVLAGCQVFVGCDSGATHLAAATGLPVLCLFSAANEVEVWKPMGSKVTVLTRHPECSPCAGYDCARTDGYFCMAEIRPEEAVAEVRSLLGP
jgi:ADP-heptose:LPS heptosyltransferase